MPRTSPFKTAFLLSPLPLDETQTNIDVILTPAFALKLSALIRRFAPPSRAGGGSLHALASQIEDILRPTPTPAPDPSSHDPLSPL